MKKIMTFLSTLIDMPQIDLSKIQITIVNDAIDRPVQN